MTNEARASTTRLEVSPPRARGVLHRCATRFREAYRPGDSLFLWPELDHATDAGQHMRARNLLMVAPLPGERR